MFLEFYGLRDQPFGVTPDPRFLYMSATHREALASLYYGIQSGHGFLALSAPPGMGKTTLLFHLLARFRNNARTAFLFQTQCSSREFMRLLLAELGIENHETDLVSMHERFNKLLLQEARAGRRFIVVVDEAQNLDGTVLETVRLLSDFETPRAKLMQIILCGQPELAGKLASHSMAQLRQRISLLSRLVPLSLNDTQKYIECRLKVAGHSGPPPFSRAAIEAIARFTKGIPRNINTFCFNALSLGCALRRRVIDSTLVEEVSQDLDLNQHVCETKQVPASNDGVIRMPRRATYSSTLDAAGCANEFPGSRSVAEAEAYMRQLIARLKWEQRSSSFSWLPR